MMEHRMGHRVPIHIPVRLHFRDGAFGQGIAVNINRGGVFVRCAPQTRLTGCVDLRMRVPTGSSERIVLIPALVVHRGNDGIGLMFRRLDRDAERVVERLAGGHEVPAEAVAAMPDRMPPPRSAPAATAAAGIDPAAWRPAAMPRVGHALRIDPHLLRANGSPRVAARPAP